MRPNELYENEDVNEVNWIFSRSLLFHVDRWQFADTDELTIFTNEINDE